MNGANTDDKYTSQSSIVLLHRWTRKVERAAEGLQEMTTSELRLHGDRVSHGRVSGRSAQERGMRYKDQMVGVT